MVDPSLGRSQAFRVIGFWRNATERKRIAIGASRKSWKTGRCRPKAGQCAIAFTVTPISAGAAKQPSGLSDCGSMIRKKAWSRFRWTRASVRSSKHEQNATCVRGCNPMKSSVNGPPGRDYSLTCVCDPPLLTLRACLHYFSPMINLHDLTTSQLHRIIAIKEQIETLQ